MIFRIESDKMHFSFSDVGAEMLSAASNDGFEYIWQGDESFWEKHAPLLFPFCGRLKDSKFNYNGKEYEMGCHGFLSKSLMEVIKHTNSSITFSLSDSENTRAVFPFGFCITVSYEVIDNTLHAKCIVENTGESELPFMFGFHPGFNLPLDPTLSKEEYYINLGCNDCLIHGLDENQCFVSQKPVKYLFDNGLYKISETELAEMGTAIFSGVSKEAKLFSRRSDRAITIRYSDEFNYLCVWKHPSIDANFICIEPWSGIPGDGIKEEILETRSSMVRLAPKETQTFEFSITFT